MARVANDADVGAQFIRIDGLGLNVERVLLDIRDSLDANLAPALDGSRNPRLVALVGAALALLLAAYQCLIDLHDTQKRGAFKRLVSQCGGRDTMPFGRRPRASFASGKRKCLSWIRTSGRSPFAQGQVGIVHDGSAHHRELVSARAAFPIRSPQRVQHTPAGHGFLHSSSFGNFSIKDIRFMESANRSSKASHAIHFRG